MIRALTLLCLLLSLSTQGLTQTATADNGSVAVVGDNNQVIIGLTEEQYEELLRKDTAQLRAELERAREDVKAAYKDAGIAEGERNAAQARLQDIERQLGAAEAELADVKTSYTKRVAELEQMVADLTAARARIPEDIFNQALTAIAQGDSAMAEALIVPLLEPQPFDDLLREQARLYTIAGDAAAQQFKYRLAAQRYTRAAQFVPDDMRYLRNASNTLHDAGDYKAAEHYADQYLKQAKQIGTPDNLATGHNILARALDGQGKYKAAEPHYQKVLEYAEAHYGQKHQRVATALNNLASNLNAQGQHDAAELLYRQALYMRRDLLGERHPDVATSLNNLAFNLNAQGKYDAAEPLFRQALDMRRDLLGGRHPDVALSLNNLAANLNEQGQYDAAEPLYRQALVMRRDLLGERHPDVAASLNNLALNAYYQGKVTEAAEGLEQALDILLEALGADHPNTLNAVVSLAFVYSKLNQMEKVISLVTTYPKAFAD